MQHALKITADGKSSIVTTDGQELGHGDVTQRVLHVLPKLYVDPEAFSILTKEAKESLIVNITSNIGVDLTPPGGIIVRQPYPNQHYFVGGSREIRNGWIVPIPNEVNEFDIEISWHIGHTQQLTNTDEWEVRHKIHAVLIPSADNTYSMDTTCWPAYRYRPTLPAPAAPFRPALPAPPSMLGIGFENYSQDDFVGRQILQQYALIDEEEESNTPVGYYLEEEICIPGIKMNQAWSIDAFQEEQLHEVTQGTKFATGNEQHRLNAQIEMPAGLLVEAVKLASAIPFEKDSDFDKSIAGKKGGCESHPALKLLADWWTEHRPVQTPHKVGFAMPWIRVRDDGEYFCGH